MRKRILVMTVLTTFAVFGVEIAPQANSANCVCTGQAYYYPLGPSGPADYTSDNYQYEASDEYDCYTFCMSYESDWFYGRCDFYGNPYGYVSGWLHSFYSPTSHYEGSGQIADYCY